MAMRASIRQAITGRGFLLALLGMAAVLLLAGAEGLVQALCSPGLLPFGTHTRLMLEAMTSQAVMLAAPLLCTLPYTTAYVDDVKSGYIKAYLPRAGVGRYVGGKLIACAVSGGGALLLGALAACVALTLVLLPKEALAKPPEGQALRLLGQLLLLFAAGALWALVGLLLSALSRSRHVAYAGPFVCCYLLIILYERYFNKLYVLYPREWMNPGAQWVLGAWGAVCWMLVLGGVVAAVFAAWVRGKLVEG